MKDISWGQLKQLLKIAKVYNFSESKVKNFADFQVHALTFLLTAFQKLLEKDNKTVLQHFNGPRVLQFEASKNYKQEPRIPHKGHQRHTGQKLYFYCLQYFGIGTFHRVMWSQNRARSLNHRHFWNVLICIILLYILSNVLTCKCVKTIVLAFEK